MTFVCILNHISRSTTWSLCTVKVSYLVKWPISTWSFMYWGQFVDLLKYETRPSSLLNFGTAYCLIKGESETSFLLHNANRDRWVMIRYWIHAHRRFSTVKHTLLMRVTKRFENKQDITIEHCLPATRTTYWSLGLTFLRFSSRVVLKSPKLSWRVFMMTSSSSCSKNPAASS